MLDRHTDDAIDDATISTLADVLPLLSEDWVYTFFFDTAPATHLDQLQQALSAPRTPTGHLCVTTCAGDPTDSPHNTQTPSEAADFLFAPSFTTGAITVGYEIAERFHQANPCPLPSRLFSRIVRDNPRKSFLAITAHPDGFTELIACVRHSPFARTITFAVADTRAFRDFVARGSPIHQLRSTLCSSFTSSEGRACPACAAYGRRCVCRAQFTVNSRPNDPQAEDSQLQSYTGGFHGVATLRIYRDARSVYLRRYPSKSESLTSKNPASRMSLSLWAMRHATSSCVMSLSRMAMPTVEQFPSDNYLTLPRHPLGDIDNRGCGDAFSVGWVLDEPSSSSPPPSSLEPLTAEEEVMKLITSLHDGCNESTADQEKMTDRSSLPGHTVQTSKDDRQEYSPSLDDLISPFQHSGVGESYREDTPTAILDQQVPVRSSRPSSSNENQTVRVYDEPYQTTVPTATAQPEEQAYVIEHITTRTAVTLAPAAVSAVQKEGADSFSEKLREKRELRKARNRESALRSNEKKRLYLQNIRSETNAAKTRETELRDREQVLRKENALLRAAASR